MSYPPEPRWSYLPREDSQPSTSARLRQVQADFAASQADLTRMERERDEALEALHTLRHSESAELSITRAELVSAQAELQRLRAVAGE